MEKRRVAAIGDSGLGEWRWTMARFSYLKVGQAFKKVFGEHKHLVVGWKVEQG